MTLEFQNLDQLVEVYQRAEDNQMALLLGSGVNGGTWARRHPACASWSGLLRVLDDHFHTQPRLQTVLGAWGDDWIKVATGLLGDKDRLAVIEAIDHAIYSGVFRNPIVRATRKRKHKVLAWTVLRGMGTLRATLCFSAAIGDPAKARSMRRNPKLGRVLTTNYDFFFSAAWPRYTSMRNSWWPVTWASLNTRPETAGPIVYLHGYLPYSGERERDLVITQDDYNRAYFGSPDSQQRFAWRELTDTLGRCHVIFIGFSFSDIPVAEALRSEKGSFKHFAFIRKANYQAIQAAKDSSVIPVLLDNWAQLPEALRRVYCAGLTPQEVARTGMSNDQYWVKLQRGLEPRKQAR